MQLFVHECADLWNECIHIRRDGFAREQKERTDQEEQARNERMGLNGGSVNFSQDEGQMFKRVWKIGYRALSIQFHPDKGGDVEQMKMLNSLTWTSQNQKGFI